MTPTIELHAQPTSLHAVPHSPRLDRAKWHTPLISIVVTHFNYSHHLRDALLSILDQTHENWECIVVDDCSHPHHRIMAAEIIQAIGSNKIRLATLDQNVGQIGAFFAGLAQTTGEFVCPLDPDDRYTRDFLKLSLEAHLSPTLYCPVVCSAQYQLKNGEALSVLTARTHIDVNEFGDPLAKRVKFIPANLPGWHWSTTSSLMLRRAALNHLRPYQPIVVNDSPVKHSLDAWLAQGAHRLGGTILLKTPLIYRGVHADNSFIRDDLCSSSQNNARDGFVHMQRALLPILADVIAHNGAAHLMPRVPEKQPGLLAKLRRSFVKRVDWLAGQLARGHQ